MESKIISTESLDIDTLFEQWLSNQVDAQIAIARQRYRLPRSLTTKKRRGAQRLGFGLCDSDYENQSSTTVEK